MYKNEFAEGGKYKAKLYGKGFTIYGLLGDDDNIDRDDIETKLRKHFYDLIIFGNIWRHKFSIELVLDTYTSSEIVFIDGEDQNNIFLPLIGRGTYFKRELTICDDLILPIHFAVPAERIGTVSRSKTKVRAFSDPTNKVTCSPFFIRWRLEFQVQ
jgi:hypothetical protein